MSDTDLRDAINHLDHFGASALVRKMGRSWWCYFGETSLCPAPFKTKGAAMSYVVVSLTAIAKRLKAQE